MPTIGYGNNEETKHMLPRGFQMFLVHIKELEGYSPCFLQEHKIILERSAQLATSHQSQCQAELAEWLRWWSACLQT
jgi:ribosomal protein L32E